MARAWLLATLVAAMAAALTTSAILVVGQGGGDAPKEPGPVGLAPDQVTKVPNGTPAESLKLPHDYGRFRIVSPGATYNYCDAAPAGRTRVLQITKQLSPAGAAPPAEVVEGPEGRIEQVKSIDELKDHALFALPPYLPAGWEVDRGEALSITWDDGSELDSFFVVNYKKSDEFYIRVTRYSIGPSCQYELIDPSRSPGLQHALTLSTIRGLPVVVQHQRPGEKIQAVLQVNYVANDVVTTVEGVAFDLDELTKIADALIAQDQGGQQ